MSGFKNEDLLGKIAVYTRVSTEDQCREPESSLDNQLHRCGQYLRSLGANDAVVESVRLYREEGKSGKDMDRPELQRLLADIKNDRIKLLVFTELSRVSRSLRDFLDLSDFLHKKDVQWISLKEQFNTTSPHGRLITVVLMALAEFERETTSLRTKLAMHDRSERGLFNGGSVPFGYEIDPTNKGKLLVSEEFGPVIREAFEVYLETGSIAVTTSTLKERGHKRPPSKKRPARHLSSNTVNYALRNPAYAGLKEVNRDKRDLPEEEVLALSESQRYRLVPAVWDAIIEMDVFEETQALLDENRQRTGNAKAGKVYAFILTGVVQCGVCMRPLGGSSAKAQRYHYYAHSPGTVTPGCGPVGHRADLVEAAVLGRLGKLADDGELLDLIVAKANERIEDGVPAKQKAVQDAEAKVLKLEADQERFAEHLIVADPCDVPAFIWKKARSLEEDVATAKGEVVRRTIELREAEAARLNPEDYRSALRTFTEVYEHLDALQKSDLLAYLLDRVEVRAVFEEGKQVATEITIALLGDAPDVARYEKGADGAYHQPPKWLRQLGSNQRPSG